MSRIFINYRRQDTEGYAGRLYDHLLRYFAVNDVFMDINDISVGADFVTTLEDALAKCDVLLAVIGPQWVNITDEFGNRRLEQPDDFVRLEIATAIAQEKRVIPVLVGGARMPAESTLSDDIKPLARRNAHQLSHKNFATDIETLAETIRQIVLDTRRGRAVRGAPTGSEKAALVKTLRDDVLAADKSPLYAFRKENGHFPVVGDGNPDAPLLFIGQSPAISEARVGRAFVGASGDFLVEMLRDIGLEREDVFITNVVLDALPIKRDPTSDELKFYAPFVDRLIDIIQPAVLVPLGGYAMTHVLKKYDVPEKNGKISQLHGTLIDAKTHYGAVYIVPMYHPAMALYSPKSRDMLKKDFAKLKNFI